MKRYERFIFTIRDYKASQAVVWLEALDITPTESKVDSYFTGRGSRGNRICDVDVRVPVGDDRPRRLAEAIKALGVTEQSLTHREEIDYAKSDLLAAPVCAVLAAPNAKVQTGAVHGTQYIWTDACKTCGIGRKQVGPLVAKRSQLPKGRMIVLSNDHDWLISQRLHDELIAKVDGAAACLCPVIERSTGETLDYRQIVPGSALPALHGSTSGSHGTPCPRCQRVVCGHDIDSPYQPVFAIAESQQSMLAPFMKTDEYWGWYGPDPENSQLFHPPAIGLVVRNDVVRALLDLKVRGIDLIPARFV